MKELDNKMSKINKLEREISSINCEMNKKYYRITCNFDSHCYFPVTYLPIPVINLYPNYTETMICDECSNYII